MTTIILTNHAVATEDGIFDPSSIARFIVEHSRDERTQVYLVVDMMNRVLHPLADFARRHGFVVWAVSTTGRALTRSDEIDAAITHAGAADDVVVCDPFFESDDPRVVVERRITR